MTTYRKLTWEKCGEEYVALEPERDYNRRAFVVAPHRGDWQLIVEQEVELTGSLREVFLRADQLCR